MRHILLTAAVAVALLAAPETGTAAVIGSLGVNPNSAQGAFSNAPGVGAFEDQFTFTLSGGPQFLSIVSVTNTFAAASDFIASFTGAVYTSGADGIINNADDVAVIGPVGATACPVQDCQRLAGAALLNPGSYYLELAGTGSGTSGYGGNLAVRAVPGPVLGAGLPALLALLGLWGLRRRRA